MLTLAFSLGGGDCHGSSRSGGYRLLEDYRRLHNSHMSQIFAKSLSHFSYVEDYRFCLVPRMCPSRRLHN